MTDLQQGTTAIWARGLHKAYGDKQVLTDLDLAVRPQSVFALLGPNGSGKTTTVQILTTLLHPDGGEARVGGRDVVAEANAVRLRIGVTGQFSAVDKLLTGAENLRLIARLRHMSRTMANRRIAELLEAFDLTDAAHKPLYTYSGGMRRKLDLAMTLVDRPATLFLDEPTTGLDPRSRAGLWQIVRDVVADGTTVFLTTQYLEEADRLADTVAVLNDGRIAAYGTPTQLKAMVGGGHIELVFADVATLERASRTRPDAIRDEDTLTLRAPSDGGIGSVRTLIEQLDHDRVEPLSLTVNAPDLDDVFFSLTGPERATSANDPDRCPAGTSAGHDDEETNR